MGADVETVERLFRVAEVAALLARSYRTIRDDISSGRIRVVRVGTRGVRVPEAEVYRLTGQKPRNASAAAQEPAAGISVRGAV